MEGYLIDIACVRKYRRDELLRRAKAHTRACGTEGHCVESGYALVSEDGQLVLLDSEATPKLLQALLKEERDNQIKFRVIRESNGSKMETTEVIAI